ncbi:MAG TPA: carboxypeptidase-like regulatory domain-containing protein [Bacteroidia bacterium]|nr:carboxypeptidase-like regulatory domain-containing protein [Bacteroidia bacterium]
MSKMYRFSLFFGLLLIVSSFRFAHGQALRTEGLIQFSGVIVTGDSLKPIPFVSITIKDTYRGTISDYNGFFSMVARPRDTIEFSAIGYKRGSYIIPDTLQSDRYSMVRIMVRDTVLLEETVIYPWPTKDQFKQAFLNLHLPDNDLDRARRNIALEDMRELMLNTPMDGSGNYKALMLDKQASLYRGNGYYSISLLNPIAWAKFIEAWQRGDYKKKSKN